MNEENVIKRSHFIPNTFSHNETNPFSSIFYGNEAKSTCSNWYELFAKVFNAYLHLYLSINPSLLRSNNTNMFEIYYLLKIPVLKPKIKWKITLFLFEFKSLDEELIDILGLFITEIRTQILEKLNDSVFSKILISLIFQWVIIGDGHIYSFRFQNLINVINLKK